MANKNTNNILEPQRSIYYTLFNIAQIISIVIVVFYAFYSLTSSKEFLFEEGKDTDLVLLYIFSLLILLPNLLLGIITSFVNYFNKSMPKQSAVLFIISALGTIFFLFLPYILTS